MSNIELKHNALKALHTAIWNSLTDDQQYRYSIGGDTRSSSEQRLFNALRNAECAIHDVSLCTCGMCKVHAHDGHALVITNSITPMYEA